MASTITSTCLEEADTAADRAELELITFGCRLNSYESEVIRNNAKRAGLKNAVILNTCAVTSEAVRQAVQSIRRLRRERPEVQIVVTGCAAQVDPHRFAAMAEVDHVVGNAEKLGEAAFRKLTSAPFERVQVDDIMSVREMAPHMINGLTSHTRAFVQIQNGCDHRCTFCIIPYGRGPSRSIGAGEVVAQVRRLVDNGILEVVLTGVDVTSYGADLAGNMTLGKLVRDILKHVPNLSRLRISSIDQVEAQTDSDLMAAIGNEERLMPHFHLSLQSGNDLILKRMKRRHLRRDAVEFCGRVRKLRPDVVFGADLIAGFPTETEAMFQDSLSLVDECNLTFLHVFPYSARQGTPAARMPQVRGDEIKSRAARLRAKGSSKLADFLEGEIGKSTMVLMEKSGVGRTPQYAEVSFRASTKVPEAGTLLRSRVVGRLHGQLLGEVLA